MTTFYIISGILFLLIVAVYVIFFKSPSNSVILYLFDWEYRALLSFRYQYQSGLRRDPPTDYSYFRFHMEDRIRNEYGRKPQVQKQDLLNMLANEEYIQFYFQQDKSFDGAAFLKMYHEYRSGEYLKIDYLHISKLEKNLPYEISSSPGALSDFKKLIEVGWFDPETGCPTGKVEKQHIGRAINMLAFRNKIKNPSRVFSALIGEPESRIREWMRINKYDDQISNKIDEEIRGILGPRQ